MARGDGYRKHQVGLCREKIQTTQLLKRLQDNALGLITLTGEQIRSIEILLRKALPDLSAVEHTGDTVQPFAVLPAIVDDTKRWESAFKPSGAPLDAVKPSKRTQH